MPDEYIIKPPQGPAAPPPGDISPLVRDDSLPQQPAAGAPSQLRIVPPKPQPMSPYVGYKPAPEADQRGFKETGRPRDTLTQVVRPDPQTGERKLYERTTPPSKGLSWPQRVAEYWRDEPGVYYGQGPFSFFKVDEGTGETSLSFPEWFRSTIRGTAELIGAAGGELPYGGDLSDDAKATVFQMMTGPRPFRKLSEGAAPEQTMQSPGPSGIAPSWQREARPPPRLSVGGAVGLATKPLQKGLVFAWDIDKDALTQAVEMANQGYRVAPSAYAPGFARGQRWVDLSVGLKADPLKRSAERLATTGMQQTIERAGYSPQDAAALRARAAAVESPDIEPAGQAIKSVAEAEAQQRVGELQTKINEIRASARLSGEKNVAQHQRQVAAVQQDLTRHQEAIQRQIDADWQKVGRIRNVADPANLAQVMADQVRSIRTRVSGYAAGIYDAADAVGGDALANVGDSRVAAAAQQFVEELPEDLRRNNPSLIKAVNNFLNTTEPRAKGDLVIPPGRMTFGELRYLRTQLRDLGYLDNEKLSPSFKRGPYQHLAGIVDELIHSEDNQPQIRQAAQILDKADAYYAKEMARFQDHVVQSMVDNVRAGLPPDPVVISRQIMQGGANQGARLKDILNIAGPTGTDQIRSADLSDMLETSKFEMSEDLDPKRLLTEVDHRFRNGTLPLLYGPDGAREIMTLTKRLAARSGHFPLESLEQGDFRTLLQQANVVSDEVDRLAKVNPIKMMEAAVNEGKTRIKEATTGFKEAKRADILGHYANPQMMAAAAAEELLDAKNLPRLREAITRWGENSEPVRRLRLVALERIVSPLARRDDPYKVLTTLEGMSREQQTLLFPGGMADDIKRVAGQLRLMYGKTVPGMPGFATGAILDLPLNRYIQKLIGYETLAFMVTSPQFVRTIGALFRAGGRSAVQGRDLLRDRFGRWMTASFLLGQAPEEQQQAPAPALPQATPSWQQRLLQPRPSGPGGWRSRLQ